MPRGCYFLDVNWCLYREELCKFMRKEECPYFFDHGFYPYGFGEDQDDFELFEKEKFNTNRKDDDKNK